MDCKIKGFTLLETIFCIIGIALIVGLLVALMANPFKKSSIKAKATEIVDNIRMLEDAQSVFFAKYHGYGNKYELLSSGILKSWPEPDETLKDQLCVDNTGHSFEYQFWVTDDDGNGLFEIMTVLPCIKDEFAVEFNKIEL